MAAYGLHGHSDSRALLDSDNWSCWPMWKENELALIVLSYAAYVVMAIWPKGEIFGILCWLAAILNNGPLNVMSCFSLNQRLTARAAFDSRSLNDFFFSSMFVDTAKDYKREEEADGSCWLKLMRPTSDQPRVNNPFCAQFRVRARNFFFIVDLPAQQLTARCWLLFSFY